MLNCELFYKMLVKNGIDFFAGVPDSLLKDINSCILDQSGDGQHVIAANEGNAIGLAAGYHLATGKYGMVYMQNSGLGNTVNPVTSLINREVYSIPVLLMVGQRGEAGVKDEPQHTKMGEITTELLDMMGVPSEVLSHSIDEAEAAIGRALEYMSQEALPYALIVRKGTFEKYQAADEKGADCDVSREEALKIVLDAISSEDLTVSTTGKLSRELYECRETENQKHDGDFLNIGSMGHCSQIALSLALSKPARAIYCFDGDGSVIMHMGALAVIGSQGPKNFKHIVFNNGAHDSVGGQPTAGFFIDISSIATACGYQAVFKASTKEEIVNSMDRLINASGPAMLEIKVGRGARSELSRPNHCLLKAKRAFMTSVE